MFNKKTAISLADSKQASIWFDKIIPFCLDEDWKDLPVRLEDSNLFPKILLSKEKGMDVIPEYLDVLKAHHILATLIESEPEKVNLDIGIVNHKIVDEFYKISINTFYDKFPSLLNIPIIYPQIVYDKKGVVKESNFGLNMSGIEVIDTSNTEWKHILELRKDKKSLKKLRRLRLFYESNYSDKEVEFIKDDISQRIDDYKSSIKNWGFTTTIGTVSNVINSNSFAILTTAVLASKFLGNEALFTGLGAVTAVYETGNVALEVVKAKIELNATIRENPIKFIVDARKKLE